MIKRTLYFGNPAYLSKRDNQLIVDLLKDSVQPSSIPIEDVGVVILDDQQITITQGLLYALIENNAAVISCNQSHHPTGLFMPLDMNELQSAKFKAQITASEPLKKNLWQQTVKAKIINQGMLLRKYDKEVARLRVLAKSVLSGDTANNEGQASAIYWKQLFGDSFTRERNGAPPNNLLNYGYAILRAIVARGLVASGMLPTLGIFHRNQYNAYCLADDIMEPYRPFVDALVKQIYEPSRHAEYYAMTTDLKRQLLTVATADIYFKKERSPLMVGLQRTTASLARCFEGIQRQIDFPYLYEV